MGRHAELRAPTAAERLIIGTPAIGLWAAACVGVALLSAAEPPPRAVITGRPEWS